MRQADAMERTRVVVLPTLPVAAGGAVAAELVAAGIDCYLPEIEPIAADLPVQLADARRVAYVAKWLAAAEVAPPLLVVALGDTARLLPALSLSQRSAARLVVGYVVIDAASPAPSYEWPDAPVWWVATPEAGEEIVSGALSADLRGFEVLSGVAAVPAVSRVLAALGRG